MWLQKCFLFTIWSCWLGSVPDCELFHELGTVSRSCHDETHKSITVLRIMQDLELSNSPVWIPTHSFQEPSSDPEWLSYYHMLIKYGANIVQNLVPSKPCVDGMDANLDEIRCLEQRNVSRAFAEFIWSILPHGCANKTRFENSASITSCHGDLEIEKIIKQEIQEGVSAEECDVTISCIQQMGLKCEEQGCIEKELKLCPSSGAGSSQSPQHRNNKSSQGKKSKSRPSSYRLSKTKTCPACQRQFFGVNSYPDPLTKHIKTAHKKRSPEILLALNNQFPPYIFE